VGLDKQNILIYEEEVLQILYQLNEDSNSEIYTILRLNNATCIAKVTLSNGQVITKKAIKRH